MKKVLKSVSLLVACYCIVSNISAQNDVDAIRYSETNIAATARSLSMAGAFGALGADFSSLSVNPAGIGFYKRSEFTFTPALENTVTSTNYLGKNSTDNKYIFNMGNIGVVWAYPKTKKNSGWKGFAFGIGYNRLNSFHSRSGYEGVNTKNSMLDSYVEEAMGTNPNTLYYNNPYSSGLAYEAYAIDVYAPPDTTTYFSMIPNYGELQRSTMETRGSNGEMVFSVGGDYNDKIYWGVTLGFPFLHFDEDVLYEEIDQKNTIQFDTTGGNAAYANEFNFESFQHLQSNHTSGHGINGNFGLIIRPIEMLRFGVAVHFPSYYYMHDDYSSVMTTKFENGNSYSYNSPLGAYNYNLTCPWKTTGSVAFIFKQTGLISVDYEYVDYTTAKLHAYDYSFADENDSIRINYSQQHNIRAGIEYKYGIFSFRGGAGYSTPVLKESNVISSDNDQHKYTYTGGLGVREASYFVDFGYAYSQTNDYSQPYKLSNQEVERVISKITDHKFLVTIGFRF